MPGKRIRLSGAIPRAAATLWSVVIMPHNNLVLRCSICRVRCCVFSHVEARASSSAPMHDLPRGWLSLAGLQMTNTSAPRMIRRKHKDSTQIALLG